jgi:hypothetical protein
MSEEMKQDLIEDINEDQLEEMVEDVEVEDEELSEASAKKEAKDKTEAEVEVDDEDGEVEDEDDMEDDEEEDEKSESKKATKEAVEVPSTKAGLIRTMYDEMSKMNREQLEVAFGKMMAEDVEEEVQAEVVAEAAEEVEVSPEAFKEDLDALVGDEESLTEDFRDKAAVIFEAAVKSKVAEERSRLEENFQADLAEQVESVRSDLVEKVDGYLNYVVESWIEENDVEITNGLRTEIAENFIESLKSLFVESYIEVPAEKADFVDGLAQKVEELEEHLNKSVEDNIELAEKIAEYRRDEVLREATVGMAETEVEKLRSLTEGLDYEDQASFEKKVATIKESYFKVKGTEQAEELNETKQDVEVTSTMAAYLKVLNKK